MIITEDKEILLENNCSNNCQEDNLRYKDSTYEIVSKVAYLIGVPLNIFENEHESPKLITYLLLDKDKNARIIRHLCIVRNSLERRFKRISDLMYHEHKTLSALKEYIPNDSLQQLSVDNINFVKNSHKTPLDYIIEINRIISDRINNCKSIFPLWLNWQYVKELFVMDKGLTEQGAREQAECFYSNLSNYPYGMYINWKPQEKGNILYNDKKFVSIIYELHNDSFMEMSKVSDVGAYVKDTIYNFIENNQKIVMVVDCENSDPYKLSATFRNLNSDYAEKISKIILLDDEHTATAWRILEQFTEIPVEHIMLKRIKEGKSYLDISLSVKVCQEYYENNADSIIIVSSDSDYWGLIDALNRVNYLVMVERQKCGPDLKSVLIQEGIFYCYIDDFYSGNVEDVKRVALFKEMRNYIDETVKFNVKEMLEKALMLTRINMNSSEQKQFYEKYLKNVRLALDEEGYISIEFNN